jgi:hypothetical protein
MQNTDPEGYDVFVRSLAATGNPAAGFLAGIDNIFGRNRGTRPPLDELHRAAQAEHRGVAYVAAVVLYTFYSGADADDTAFVYMKQVEGEAPGQWRRRMLNNVHSLYFWTRGVNLATQMRTITLRDGRRCHRQWREVTFNIAWAEPSAVGSRARGGLPCISVVMNVGFVLNVMPSSLVLIMFSEAKMDAAIQFHPHEVQQGNRVFCSVVLCWAKSVQVLVAFCACLSVL